MTELELEIIEKMVGTMHPIAVLCINNKTGSMFWSVKAQRELNLKERSGVLYSINKSDNTLYLAFENEVSSGKNTFSIGKKCYPMPVKLKYKLPDGIYKIHLNPVYSKGFDWYKCELIEDERGRKKYESK